MLKYTGPINKLISEYNNVFELLEAEYELSRHCQHENTTVKHARNKRREYFVTRCLDCGKMRLNTTGLNDDWL